jgi:hypothetical protein
MVNGSHHDGLVKLGTYFYLTVLEHPRLSTGENEVNRKFEPDTERLIDIQATGIIT